MDFLPRHLQDVLIVVHLWYVLLILSTIASFNCLFASVVLLGHYLPKIWFRRITWDLSLIVVPLAMHCTGSQRRGPHHRLKIPSTLIVAGQVKLTFRIFTHYLLSFRACTRIIAVVPANSEATFANTTRHSHSHLQAAPGLRSRCPLAVMARRFTRSRERFTIALVRCYRNQGLLLYTVNCMSMIMPTLSDIVREEIRS